MAIVDKATLKTYFETGDVPTEAQFINLIDTLVAFASAGVISLGNDEEIRFGDDDVFSVRFNSADEAFEIYNNEDGEAAIKIEGLESTFDTIRTSGLDILNGVFPVNLSSTASSSRVVTIPDTSGTMAVYANDAVGNVTGAQNLDWSNSTSYSYTLTGNTTLSFINEVDGKAIVVAVSTGTGGFTLDLPDVDLWKDGSAPTLTTTASKTDIFTFVKIGSLVYGSVIQNF